MLPVSSGTLIHWFSCLCKHAQQYWRKAWFLRRDLSHVRYSSIQLFSGFSFSSQLFTSSKLMTTKWEVFSTERCFLLHNRKSPWRNAVLHHERGMSLVSFLFVPQLCSSPCPCSVGPLGQRTVGSGFAELAMQGRAGGLSAALAGKGHLLCQAVSAVLRTLFSGTWEQQAEQGGVDLCQGLYRRKWNPSKPGKQSHFGKEEPVQCKCHVGQGAGNKSQEGENTEVNLGRGY